MARFAITVATRGYEVWYVDAESLAEARESYWDGGDMVDSGVDFCSVVEIEEMIDNG